jgi:vacuolar protein sorting-associated protein 45
MQLLVLDRMDDPVTPLLAQWTYQAMLHELVGIKNNRVTLPNASSKDMQDIVISSTNDGFFKENMYSNYGDLGLAIKKLVDDFQAVSKMNKQIESIEDMQRFIDSFPEFRQHSGNVSKHVALMSELSRIIGDSSLMAVSQVEQEIACGSDRVYAYNSTMELLADSQVKPKECLKLVLLFALRYEKEGARQVDEMVKALARRNFESANLTLVKDFVKRAGQEHRTGDLFGNRDFFARASKMVGGLKGADNVYTQHQPLLVQTLENLSKGKMKETDYPFVSTTRGPRDAKPQDVLVFIIGGVTYEEARFVAQMNDSGQGFHVTLGGTTILNSGAFVHDLTHSSTSV